ncbi:hypothetical protein ZWY2020_025696 [Hordeum vulgare]|nr:hypothetical protein ZWY2020_025696 [Hordeum vulgare]
MLYSFGGLVISPPANNHLLHRLNEEQSTAILPGPFNPAVHLPRNEWVTNRGFAATVSWDRLADASSAQHAYFHSGGPDAMPLNSWEAFVARTPAIDFSALQGAPPIMPPEVNFGPGVQLKRARSDRNQMQDVAQGREIVNAIISRVASLPSEKQHWFIERVADLLSPSLLGVPAKSDPSPGQARKKLFASMTKMTKSNKARAVSSSFMASRKSQARFCVRLGLIKDISEFNEEILKMYLSFFKNPMPEPLLSKLAEVAGIKALPCINLPDEDLQLILDELSGKAR